MERGLHTWKFILHNLQQGIPVMMLYVLHSEGSSPGRQGFFMAVNAEGRMQGSIGGGIMEYKFVEMAKDQLAHYESLSGLRKQHHNKSAPKDQSGMICSGEQTLFMSPLQQHDCGPVQEIIACLEKEENGLLQLSPAGLFFSAYKEEADFFFEQKSETDWLYREKIGYKNHLHVIGAGHCALALCKLMREMDFYIHLYDDRPDLNTFTENPFAHRKTLLGHYSELKALIPPESQYAVVMTIGYRTDDLVLRTVMDKRFVYLGVLGSKYKLEQLFEQYRREGMEEALLARIYAPVGMAINSQTPEEIAVSIAAQIISVKNGADKNS
ncbi:MAG: XdhC family protein [Williamsia sp.]|nr:XdhC family protein [Williamsia sp.]